LTRHLHSRPEDAFRVHLDLEARTSVGIHWGTFTTDTGARETRAEVERLERKDFRTIDVGLWTEGGTDPVEWGLK
jgi:L-ascorbate metabolism protein UlaG (beta-lactamase superfamily)